MARFRFHAPKAVKNIGRKVGGVAGKGAAVVLPAVGALIAGTAGSEAGAIAATGLGRYTGAAAARGKGKRGVDARTAGRKQAKRNFAIGQAVTAVTGGVQLLRGQNLTEGIFNTRAPAANPQTATSDVIAEATGANVNRASQAEGSGLVGQALDQLGLGKPNAQQSPAGANVPASADMYGGNVPLAAAQNEGGEEPDLLSPSTWPAWYWVAAVVVIAGGAVAVGAV